MEERLLTARTWLTPKAPFDFPETKILALPDSTTGICFSGGGNRALSAAIGQLRGLNHLGLLSKCHYLSAVSGGSWAATVFSFADVPLKQLLGSVQENLKNITLQSLRQTPANYLGVAPTKSLFSVFSHFFKRIPDEDVWINTVRQIYLQPYGLNENKFFSLSHQTIVQIAEKNRQLMQKNFYTPVQGRPFLIVNGTLIWPEELLEKENRLLFEYTPIYVGIPQQHTLINNHIPLLDKKRKVGNGLLANFAFKSTVPVQYRKTSAQQIVRVPIPEPFTLFDMIGSSSAFFSAVLDKYPFAKDLSPMFNYWPISSTGYKNVKSHRYSIGDGGNLENYGILSLLLRQVSKIVVFINTETALDNPHQDDLGEWADIDGYLPPLFGYNSKFWRVDDGRPTTQVFQSEDFMPLIRNLMQQKVKGKSLIYKADYQVLDNKKFGISSKKTDGQPYVVTVLWVYNAKVPAWKAQLAKPLQNEIDKGVHGLFANFPHYPTVGSDFDFFDPLKWHDLGGLTLGQVNLLANLSCWNVYSNANLFQQIFK